MKTLRLILGDQLNAGHSWFSTIDPNVTYILMEMRQETDYVAHHIQKIIAFFLSMRTFAAQRQAAGHTVIYLPLDDLNNRPLLTENLLALIEKENITHFEYQLPDEFRLDAQLKSFCESLTITSQAVDSEHFMSERHELEDFFKGKKTYLMESFYRYMRKKHRVMVDAKNEPWTGQWNYDADNRSPFPKNHVATAPLLFSKDVTALLAMIQSHGVKSIGTVDAKDFIWPTSRAEALELLGFFMKECLPLFGKFQDAIDRKSVV